MSLKPFEYLIVEKPEKSQARSAAELLPKVTTSQGPIVVMAESSEQAKLKAAQACQQPIEEVDIYVRPFCQG